MLSTGIDTIMDNLPLLLDGLWNTLFIALISMVISAIGGFGFGLLRMTKNDYLRLATDIYLELFRIIPLMVWLFSFFFYIPSALGINISGELVSIIVFSLWGSAEMGDIVRGAMQSLAKGQLDAGLSIGLNKMQLFFYIKFPQAIKRMIPGGISLFTRMIKTTSIAVLIGVMDVIKRGQQIIERTKQSFWVYLFLFLIFFLICYPLSKLSKKLEEKWES